MPSSWCLHGSRSSGGLRRPAAGLRGPAGKRVTVTRPPLGLGCRSTLKSPLVTRPRSGGGGGGGGNGGGGNGGSSNGGGGNGGGGNGSQHLLALAKEDIMLFWPVFAVLGGAFVYLLVTLMKLQTGAETLATKLDSGLKEVKECMEAHSKQLNGRFDRLDSRLDSLSIAQTGVGMLATLSLGGLVVLLVLGRGGARG